MPSAAFNVISEPVISELSLMFISPDVVVEISTTPPELIPARFIVLPGLCK